ncbi:MAG: DUF5060 domain-containing protein, partial [Rhodothermales bacterium]
MDRPLCTIILIACTLIVSPLRVWGQTLAGNLEQGASLTITFTGPSTAESIIPNPFRDIRFDVTFAHEASGRSAVVPGYFA